MTQARMPGQAAKMALLAFLSVAQFWTQVASSCDFVFGGEETFTVLGSSIAKSSGVTGTGPPGLDYDPLYLPSSSDDAQVRLNNGTLCLAISDYPMTDYRSTWGTARSPGKYTFPVALSAYGFFVKSPAVINLDASQTYKIYKTPGADWADYAPGALSGTITKFARGDSATATYIVRQFWCKANVLCGNSKTEKRFNFKGVTYIDGAYVLAMQAADVEGAFLYSQIGVAARVSGLTEIALKNADGFYVQASSPSAIPPVLASYPKFGNRWSRINTILQPGQSTPAMVSLMVAIIGRKASPAGDTQWPKAVKVLSTLLRQPRQRFISSLYFTISTDETALARQFVASL